MAAPSPQPPSVRQRGEQRLDSGYHARHAVQEAAGIAEETHTWAGWKHLGYEVRHESKAMYQTTITDHATKSGTRRASYFGRSQVRPVIV